MPRHNGGNFCVFLALALDDWNVISLHLLAFNRRLFSLAHSWTCCNSFHHRCGYWTELVSVIIYGDVQSPARWHGLVPGGGPLLKHKS